MKSIAMISNLHRQLFMPVTGKQSIRRILGQADFLIEAGPEHLWPVGQTYRAG
jgi:hypothetical protein